MAQLLLADRKLGPAKLDLALVTPVFKDAVNAATEVLMRQDTEMEKAVAANNRVNGCIRFGQSDEVRPLIEAVKRRIEDMQRRHDQLGDPMAESREKRRRDRAAAYEAKMESQRQAAQEEERRRARELAAARRERRNQNTL